MLTIIVKIIDKHNNINGPIEKLHPIINLFRSLLILVILGCIISIFLHLLCIGILSFVKSIVAMTSNIDAVIIVALITGAISLSSVLFSTIYNTYKENKRSKTAYLNQKREVAYMNFVDMLYKVQMNGKNGFTYTDKDMLNDISNISKEITLWGSHSIINKWVQFREVSANPNHSPESILFIMEDILNEMRSDLGLKRVKKGNLLAFFVNDIKNYMKR